MGYVHLHPYILRKEKRAMSKKDVATLIAFVGILLFVIHALTIANDVQAIIEDPNKANKPGEILKLAVDFTRYFG